MSMSTTQHHITGKAPTVAEIKAQIDKAIETGHLQVVNGHVMPGRNAPVIVDYIGQLGRLTSRADQEQAQRLSKSMRELAVRHPVQWKGPQQ